MQDTVEQLTVYVYIYNLICLYICKYIYSHRTSDIAEYPTEGIIQP